MSLGGLNGMESALNVAKPARRTRCYLAFLRAPIRVCAPAEAWEPSPAQGYATRSQIAGGNHRSGSSGRS